MTKHKIATGLILKYLKLKGFVAWTSAWNTIYYVDKKALSNKCLRVHEMTHIRQMEKEGKILFMLKYAWHSIRRGYGENPYEIEAYKNQRDCLRDR